jgi:2-oxo-3-hexenedioate decarboxylase
MSVHAPDLARCADEMLRLADDVALGKRPSDSFAGFDMGAAYGVSVEMLQRREKQGWKRLGRKIGFTNRAILEQYGVFEPIFGYMYDQTMSCTAGPTATLSLDGLVQPRIEPEIIFKLRGRPPSTRDQLELLSCVEWYAHGFEIVQCHFADWEFKAVDTVADGGLHGRYIVGPPVIPEAGSLDALAAQLAAFKIVLLKNGALAAVGGGELVLGSPINALMHLVEVLEHLPDHPPLEAGELITTGTLTVALPISPGETWSTRVDGLQVTDLTLQLV